MPARRCPRQCYHSREEPGALCTEIDRNMTSMRDRKRAQSGQLGEKASGREGKGTYIIPIIYTTLRQGRSTSANCQQRDSYVFDTR